MSPPAEGLIATVPPFTIRSPQNRMLERISRKATWSGAWPGVCRVHSVPSPAATSWPSLSGVHVTACFASCSGNGNFAIVRFGQRFASASTPSTWS